MAIVHAANAANVSEAPTSVSSYPPLVNILNADGGLSTPGTFIDEGACPFKWASDPNLYPCSNWCKKKQGPTGSGGSNIFAASPTGFGGACVCMSVSPAPHGPSGFDDDYPVTALHYCTLDLPAGAKAPSQGCSKTLWGGLRSSNQDTFYYPSGAVGASMEQTNNQHFAACFDFKGPCANEEPPSSECTCKGKIPTNWTSACAEAKAFPCVLGVKVSSPYGTIVEHNRAWMCMPTACSQQDFDAFYLARNIPSPPTYSFGTEYSSSCFSAQQQLMDGH
jgi:hypothetical protein